MGRRQVKDVQVGYRVQIRIFGRMREKVRGR
jgi:hypothetical protein